jgi:hypothetical protein
MRKILQIIKRESKVQGGDNTKILDFAYDQAME